MIEPTELEAIRESRSSIELRRDFKGTYAWAIKLYFDAQTDDEGALLEQLGRLDAQLRARFISPGSTE